MNTSVDLIKQYLPKDLREKAKEFNIPEIYLKKRPDLIVLILNSKSMDTNQEKQSWFNLMPMMTQEQLNKLNDILTREKIKLSEIEKKYEEKKKDIKDKYIKRRQTMGYTKKMEAIKKKESTNKKEDIEDAEELLNQI